nr:serine/threonine-protein kinase [Neptunicella marina]
MKLEGYRILQTVFQGQRSCLYKVVNEQDGKIYGLKAPTQQYASDKDYLRGFAHESWIGQRVNHPNVMRIHHRPEKTAFLYHVCEYIEGQTLRQWMVDNPKPSLDQVRVIIKQIVAALRALQRLDMVHRDLRPENIMISTQNQVKLIDFGSVYVAGLDEDQPQPSNFDGSNLTYVSPEYVLEHQSSHQSDIFSLAVICYEMLSGAMPYPAISRQSSVPHSYTKWDYESLGKHRNELPPWVNLTLKKALQPQPENRYQAFSEFETDLLKPNQSMIEAAQDAPLIERNPLLFWKLVSGVLLAANLIQFIV